MTLATRKSSRKLSFRFGNLPMSKLAELKAARTLHDLAAILNMKPTTLSFILYKIPVKDRYTTFEIPKSNGTKRTIHAPHPKISFAQKRLSKILTTCIHEIRLTRPSYCGASHGFQNKRSIQSNAKLHEHRRHVVNCDIKDFFPSINFGRVQGFFIKDAYFGLYPKIAQILAHLACFDGRLPQGSPCSPVISNLIGNLLDARLSSLAKANKTTYSRYADDLTFSTNMRALPPGIVLVDPHRPGGWIAAPSLEDCINRAGFVLNSAKTHVQSRPTRQIVTGLTVNAKVNIPSDYFRTVRAMATSLFRTGMYYNVPEVGLADPPPQHNQKRIQTSRLAPLEGKLNYIYQVKNNQRSSNRDANDSDGTKQILKVYRKFLFFKYFINASKPLILTEGPTDRIYLQSAAKHDPVLRAIFHPDPKDPLSQKFSYFNYNNKSAKLLSLPGSTSYLKTFIEKYSGMMAAMPSIRPKHAVIVLVDNDQGCVEIFKMLRNKFSLTIDPTTTDRYYHVTHNLYLVKTPEKPPTHMSQIEDFFDPALLLTVLDGKILDLNKDHDAPGKYGKTVFASRVVRAKGATIDFSGFRPLFDRLQHAADHYSLLPP